MKAEKIIQILVNEKNYDRVQTERLIPKIEALSSDIKEALLKWIESGDMSSPEYSGYTVAKILKAKPEMTELGAYLALDWIRKDPTTAIKAVLAPTMRFMPNKKQ